MIAMYSQVLGDVDPNQDMGVMTTNVKDTDEYIWVNIESRDDIPIRLY